MSDNYDDYVFFWKINQENGYMSQWYRSPFKTRIQFTTDDGHPVDTGPEPVYFPTAEHFMMACKALLFYDTEIYNRVVANSGRSEADLKMVKGLGRKVKGFREEVWLRNRDEIVLRGTTLKFEQNEGLKRRLLDTGEKIIVEASPLDRIWGIGYGKDRALEMRDSWGLNLLGIALMKAREALRTEGSSAAPAGEEISQDLAQS